MALILELAKLAITGNKKFNLISNSPNHLENLYINLKMGQTSKD
jgi:hypothetical protein